LLGLCLLSTLSESGIQVCEIIFCSFVCEKSQLSFDLIRKISVCGILILVNAQFSIPFSNIDHGKHLFQSV
jgi:hypothetical protein